MKIKTIGLVIILTILGSGMSHAQFGEFLPVWFKLQDADVAAITAAEDRILANQPVKAGAAEMWTGQGTGNAGKVSILKLFKKNGLPCLETAYDIKIARAAEPIRYVVPWCRTADGSWKMFF